MAISPTPERQDRLSALPDSILLLILSYLPTLYAVHTSLLSRRWRYLWTAANVLDFVKREIFLDECGGRRFSSPTTGTFYGVFDDGGRTRKIRMGTEMKGRMDSWFSKFVGKAFAFNDAPALEKMRLSCRGSNGFPIEDWVRIAVTRQVKELDLEVLGYQARLPPRLFVSHSLVDLRLSLGDAELKLPVSMGLPNLRSMRLVSVVFPNDHSTRKLFSSCPALRKLALVGCSYRNLGCLDISCPLLQTFIIENHYMSSEYDLCDCQVKISAPQLTSLVYRASLARAYEIELLPSLGQAKVAFFVEDRMGSDRMPAFLHQLSCTRELRIDDECVVALSTIATSPTRSYVPPFRCLRRLKMKVCVLDYAFLCLVLKFLLASPYLKTLVLEFEESEVEALDSNGLEFEDSEVDTLDYNDKNAYTEVAKVYSNQTFDALEEVEIRCSGFCQAVLDLVKILLENQACLQRLLLSDFVDYHDFSAKKRSMVVTSLMNELLSFPRRSHSLAVSFV